MDQWLFWAVTHDLMKSRRWWHWAWLGLACCLAGCGILNSEPAPTPTTPRLPDAAASYANPARDAQLSVTLERLSWIAEAPAQEVQVIAVLAAGDGQPAYLVYPARQPGVPADEALVLDRFPLEVDASSAQLWVLALRYRAYPVPGAPSPEDLGWLLAWQVDQLRSGGEFPVNPVASLVAADAGELLPWFGGVEVLDELAAEIDGSQSGAQQVQGLYEQMQLAYNTVLAPLPLIRPPEETAAPSPTTALEGYRRVVYEDFADAQSNFTWFVDSDNRQTYAASLVNGAYQIELLGKDAWRDYPLSWGSLQGLFFDNYVVRARVRVANSGFLMRYGLWLHYLDDRNFLYFGLENTGRYRVARFRSRYLELQNWTANSAILPGTQANELEVRVEGNSYTLNINGQGVITVADDAFDVGRIAFFCYAETEVTPQEPAVCLLEALEVWIPQGAPFPLASPTPAE
ncbi:MAG: hypothetical protein HC915_09935 [Anaerolineae bacterium]|nr:hypothetical protein [Anaerolineae bacterium]